MLYIKPDTNLVYVKLEGQALYLGDNYTFYYPLELNPFGFQRKGAISVAFDNQTRQLAHIMYYLPVDPLLFMVKKLQRIEAFYEMEDVVFEWPECTQHLRLEACQFLDTNGTMVRFNSQKYIAYCKKKYAQLYHLGCECLAPIFFKLNQYEIIGTESTIKAPSTQRTAGSKPKSGPMDRFLRKK